MKNIPAKHIPIAEKGSVLLVDEFFFECYQAENTKDRQKALSGETLCLLAEVKHPELFKSLILPDHLVNSRIK